MNAFKIFRIWYQKLLIPGSNILWPNDWFWTRIFDPGIKSFWYQILKILKAFIFNGLIISIVFVGHDQMTVHHDQMTVGRDQMTVSCDQTTVGMGYYYLGRLWMDFENSKAIDLVCVTDEETK